MAGAKINEPHLLAVGLHEAKAVAAVLATRGSQRNE
jgi:hypothetical protein